jgi:hypothetical protein
VTVKYDLVTAGVEAQQCGCQQVASRSGDHVLNQHAVPGADRLPLRARIVHVFDVRGAVLELAVGHEPRARIIDGAAARQGQLQVAAIEGGDDGRGRACHPHREGRAVAKGVVNRAHQPVPEPCRHWMGGAPLADVGLDIGVTAFVLGPHDPAPRPDRAAVAAAQVAAFPLLALKLADLLDRDAEHARGDHAIVIEARLLFLVASRVELEKVRELPLLARIPGEHARFDRTEVGTNQLVPLFGA